MPYFSHFGVGFNFSWWRDAAVRLARLGRQAVNAAIGFERLAAFLPFCSETSILSWWIEVARRLAAGWQAPDVTIRFGRLPAKLEIYYGETPQTWLAAELTCSDEEMPQEEAAGRHATKIFAACDFIWIEYHSVNWEHVLKRWSENEINRKNSNFSHIFEYIVICSA